MSDTYPALGSSFGALVVSSLLACTLWSTRAAAQASEDAPTESKQDAGSPTQASTGVPAEPPPPEVAVPERPLPASTSTSPDSSRPSSGRAASAPGSSPQKPAPAKAEPAGRLQPEPGSMPPSPTAQTDPCECAPRGDKEGEGAGRFLLGAAFLDLSSLNDRLRAAGYEEYERPITLIGGEARGVTESGFVAGIHGAAFIPPSGDGPGAARTRLRGGFIALDLGMALIHTRSLLLTVTAGLGGYGLSLSIDSDEDVPFDDVLADPARGSELTTGGFLGMLTVGFDGRLPVGEVEEGYQGFFTLGVRAGALYGAPLSDWNLPEADATDAPSGTLLGAYAAAVVGFGGMPAGFE
ncbi:MAG: hypothetical protein OXR73_01205 [Myxococcales bacterium]|nr:hypothetical protein [Myxococcales bacterium]